MNWDFYKMVSLFTNSPQGRLLLNGNYGIEKESQRVTFTGDLALTEHPAVFGNKSTNSRITTDFSESQVEMITPAFPTVEEAHQSLSAIQNEVETGIAGEFLWPLSMPPRLPEEKNIPIAKFDDSTLGREKEVYRKGLALRYGKKIQMISGIHYNFSFGSELLDFLYLHFGKGQAKQNFINDVYLAVTRNYLRYRWLLIYLFGASPQMDTTYYPVIRRDIKMIAKCCPEWCHVIEQYKQYATSLRVSRFGYADTRLEGYHGYFNNLAEYTRNIRKLLSTKSREYAKLGLYRNGNQIQLNDNVLQKESEFYAPIRLKHIAELGETNLEALEKGGVQYLEVRIIDLDPYEKVSISLQQLHFLQIFMLFCLFETSRMISEKEMAAMEKNHQAVALFGRKPNLQLIEYQREDIGLKKWAGEIFFRLRMIAQLVDQVQSEDIYQATIEAELQKIIDILLLPSARIQRDIVANHENFLDFGIRQAMFHKSVHVANWELQEAGNEH